MTSLRISDVAAKTGLSVDTLRYYERIGLLPKVNRAASGARLYNDKDLARVRFIQRAQKMDFTLAEIADLLRMREAPHKARKTVRELTARKLAEVKSHLTELKTLRDELQLLLNLCAEAKGGCPIIEEIDQSASSRRGRRPHM